MILVPTNSNSIHSHEFIKYNVYDLVEGNGGGVPSNRKQVEYKNMLHFFRLCQASTLERVEALREVVAQQVLNIDYVEEAGKKKNNQRDRKAPSSQNVIKKKHATMCNNFFKTCCAYSVPPGGVSAQSSSGSTAFLGRNGRERASQGTWPGPMEAAQHLDGMQYGFRYFSSKIH